MNTLNVHKNGMAPILPVKESVILFDDKPIDFGFPEWQLERIIELWQYGKSVAYISKIIKRNQHEVFFALYEGWIDGKINDIEKAFATGNKLLVPGRGLE